MSTIISFINSCCNINLDLLYFADVASVAGFGIGSVATFDVDFTAGSAAFSGAGSRLEILSRFFIGNDLLLKLLKTFSFALNYNLKLF